MPKLELNKHTYEIENGETVLDALLRHGQAIPHGCKSGACQSCIMKIDEPPEKLPAGSQAGLKTSLKQLGYFLSCCCKPQADLKISTVDHSGEKTTAKILEISPLSDNVLRLRLRADLNFVAGQYLNIWLDETTVRSYSIASASTANVIELHIKILPEGRFSQALATDLEPGQSLVIQGPMGECVYTPESPDAPLLLVGIGTGLAPLYGILQDALQANHKGPIHLVLGARTEAGFYYVQELLQQASTHDNVRVDFVAMDLTEPAPWAQQADLYQAIKQHHPSTQGYHIYLCGAESFVRKMKKQCFLAGASMKHIHADAFLPCS